MSEISPFTPEPALERKQENSPTENPSEQQLWHFAADLANVYGASIAETGIRDQKYEQIDKNFAQLKGELLSLLDKPDLKNDDRVKLIRDYYLRMLKLGIMSPWEHPIGADLLQDLIQKKFQFKKDVFAQKVAYLRQKINGEDVTAEEVEAYLAAHPFDEEEALAAAKIEAQERLSQKGLAFALENLRLAEKQNINQVVQRFIKEAPVIQSSAPAVFEVNALSAEQQTQLDQDFADGNFLFHGTNVAGVLAILRDGALKNSLALDKEDGVKNNSGFEGISWSFNQIDALPGDRGHLAGFVTGVEAVLRNHAQLAVPSRPAPYELIQVDQGLSVREFYQKKTQEELMYGVGFGELNNVTSNLISLQLKAENPTNEFVSSLLMQRLQDGEAWRDETQFDQYYQIAESGKIIFSADLLQQQGEKPIPLALVFLRALQQKNEWQRLPCLSQAQTLKEAVTILQDKTNSKNFFQVFGHYIQEARRELLEVEKQVKPLSQDVSTMYLVVPNHDLEKWQAVLQRCQAQPKGIIVYDGEKVRLENFASRHHGDHNQLTQELRQFIPFKDAADGYLDYNSTFLNRDTDEEVKRAGHRGQVIRESLVADHRSLKLDETGKRIIA